MSELKCYVIDMIGDDEKTINKASDILKKYGVVGVHVPEVPILPGEVVTHCLFNNVTDRYMAYNELKAADIKCELNPIIAWVDEKYIH